VACSGVGDTLNRPRLLYIDNLRILLTALVILHHLAVTYGGPGSWAYIEEGEMSAASSMMITLLVTVNQSFFMGLFFLISSFFSPGSYDRKGPGPYLKDRLKRLGIPLLFYLLVVSPLLNYRLSLQRGFQGSLGEFISSNLGNWEVGPLWFVAALLLFSFVYVLWRLLARPAVPPTPSEDTAPSNLAIAALALAMGLLTFAVRIWLPVGWALEPLGFQFPHFVQYIALFIVGLLAYRRNWLSGLSDDQGRVWLRAILVLVLLFFVLFITGGALQGDLDPYRGGLRWQSFAYAIWEQFMGMAMVVTLLVWFRNRFDHQGPLAQKLSTAAYATYVFHEPVIILLALALLDIRLDQGLKWVLVAPLAVSLSFLVGHIVKRMPLARDVL
jgi:fucose 4-O-acetylase-like acetyltransferase